MRYRPTVLLAAVVSVITTLVVAGPASAYAGHRQWPSTCAIGGFTSVTVRADHITLDVAGTITPCAAPGPYSAWSLTAYNGYGGDARLITFNGTAQIGFRFAPQYSAPGPNRPQFSAICLASGPVTRVACLLLNRTGDADVTATPIDPADPRFNNGFVTWPDETPQPGNESHDGGWHCATCV
jgi:hypothetical protein